MKVSGFTFCRDGIRFDFPVLEAIRSILPIVDEYIVNVGKSDDGTLEMIKSIGDSKIRIVESEWDENLRDDGAIFAQQTNIALDECTGDWAFCLQADEIVHEEDLPKIRTAMRRYMDDPNALGLMFRYLHFKGDYQSIDPYMYRREIRVIRNNGRVRSFRDACGFAYTENSDLLSLKDRKNLWRNSGARIFHYGWVKNPRTFIEKKRLQVRFHHGDDIPEREHKYFETDSYECENYEILKEFRKTHPQVMNERVANFPRLRSRRNRWLNPAFYKYVFQHGFKG